MREKTSEKTAAVTNIGSDQYILGTVTKFKSSALGKISYRLPPPPETRFRVSRSTAVSYGNGTGTRTFVFPLIMHGGGRGLVPVRRQQPHGIPRGQVQRIDRQ